MNAKHLKILGGVLLILGIGIIIWTLLFSYNIFTGRVEAPSSFDVEQEEISLPSENNETDIEKAMEDQISAMLPIDGFQGMFDLVSWSILAFILIFGGSSLAGLGIKMLKNN